MPLRVLKFSGGSVDDDAICRSSWVTVLTYYAFPGPLWRQIRRNDPLKRIIREMRTRVVAALPDGQSGAYYITYVSGAKGWGCQRVEAVAWCRHRISG
jgi:transposase-like protein